MKWFIFISKSIEWVHFFLSCSRSLSAKWNRYGDVYNFEGRGSY
jgi:hypothetical protein